MSSNSQAFSKQIPISNTFRIKIPRSYDHVIVLPLPQKSPDVLRLMREITIHGNDRAISVSVGPSDAVQMSAANPQLSRPSDDVNRRILLDESFNDLIRSVRRMIFHKKRVISNPQLLDLGIQHLYILFLVVSRDKIGRA